MRKSVSPCAAWPKIDGDWRWKKSLLSLPPFLLSSLPPSFYLERDSESQGRKVGVEEAEEKGDRATRTRKRRDGYILVQ